MILVAAENFLTSILNSMKCGFEYELSHFKVKKIELIPFPLMYFEKLIEYIGYNFQIKRSYRCRIHQIS